MPRILFFVTLVLALLSASSALAALELEEFPEGAPVLEDCVGQDDLVWRETYHPDNLQPVAGEEYSSEGEDLLLRDCQLPKGAPVFREI